MRSTGSVIDLSTTPKPARVRFPAPYRPAGSAATGSRAGTRTSTTPVTYPRSHSVPAVKDAPLSPQPKRGADAGRLVDHYRTRPDRRPTSAGDRTGTPPRSSRGVPVKGRTSTGAPDAGTTRPGQSKEVYDRGPVDRLANPRRTTKTPGNSLSNGGKPTKGAASAGNPKRATRGGKTTGSRSGKVTGGNLSAVGELAAKEPREGKQVLKAGNTIARLGDRGLAAGAAVVGGVYAPGAYIPGTGGYGDNDCYYDDWYWGWYGGWYGGRYGGWGWGWNNCWWDSWYWCWWSCYQCWYYPYWYQFYRPYCWSYPSYYSTVVYRTVYEDVVEETVYVDEEPAEEVVYTVVDPVGEAIVAGERGEFPAEAQPSALSVAAERYLTLGDRAFREGRYADAVQFYAKAVDFASDQGALYLVLSDALFAAGDYHYGAYAVRKALELEPTLVEAVVDKHTFYLDPAEFDRQLAVGEQYVLDHPTDRDARLVLALNMLFGGRPAVAVDLYEQSTAPATALQRDQAVELILRVAREVQYGTKTTETTGG